MKTTKTKIILVILLFAVAGEAYSHPVDMEMARRLAQNFMGRTRSTSNTVSDVVTEQLEGHDSFYVVNFREGGWVMVSANDATIPVLAYSYDATYRLEDEKPGGFLFLIDGYKEEVDIARKTGATGGREVMEMWSQLLVDDGNNTSRQSTPPGSRTYTPGAHLLNVPGRGEVAWGQSKNNDDGCSPAYNDEIKKKWYQGWFNSCNCDAPPVGCGAVAMGQVMWYWQWPNTYDWNLMPVALTNSSTTEEGDAVAQLLYDCAEASNMVYACGGSFTVSIESALSSTFGYTTIELHAKNDYTSNAWDDLIRAEIDGERPVIYYGEKAHISSEKHYFIVDGYESPINNNYFHINFGWRWNDYGNFYLNNINPSTHDFSKHHYAFINISPPLPVISGPSSVCTTGSTFSVAGATTVQWSISDTDFSLSNQSNTSVTVTKTGLGNSPATLTALVNGVMTANTTITPCQTKITQFPAGAFCTGTFELINLPTSITGSQVTWSCSSNMQLIGGNTGLTKEVKVIYPISNNETGWVRADIGQTYFSRTVYLADVSDYAYIAGSSTLDVGLSSNYILKEFTYPEAEPESAQCGCYSVSFTTSSNLSVSYALPPCMPEEEGGGDELEEDPPRSNPIELEGIDPDGAKAQRGDPEPEDPEEPDEPIEFLELPVTVHALDCGSGWLKATIKLRGQVYTVQKNITVTGCRGDSPSGGQESIPNYVSVYPNPASKTLHIDIDREAYAAFLLAQDPSGGKMAKHATFRISLYNDFGQLQLQTTTHGHTHLNTSKLPKGLYFLHVHDGSENKPLVQKIQINH